MIIPKQPFLSIKIIDGLFIGDQAAANSIPFLQLNKISTILNCSGEKIHIEQNIQNCRIIQIYWKETSQIKILDPYDNNIQSILNLFENSSSNFQGILICEIGYSKALTIIIALFIKKYRWSLYKIFQFMNYRKKQLEIQQIFLKQLKDFQCRQRQKNILSQNWYSTQISNEALILRNTFINSQKFQIMDENKKIKLKKNTKTVKIVLQVEIINEQQIQDQYFSNAKQLDLEQIEPKKPFQILKKNNTIKQNVQNLKSIKYVGKPNYRIRRNSQKRQRIRTQITQQSQRIQKIKIQYEKRQEIKPKVRRNSIIVPLCKLKISTINKKYMSNSTISNDIQLKQNINFKQDNKKLRQLKKKRINKILTEQQNTNESDSIKNIKSATMIIRTK